ncbi:MAG: Mov34/MPN/PAD-1 family protein [Patescibacteria group bacterium]
MPAAGYLINYPGRLSGEKGFFFDYILAAGGLYVRSETPLLRATIKIAEAEVRGLAPIEEKIEMVHGKVPSRTGRLALSIFEASKYEEKYLAITWDKERYHIRQPEQSSTSCSIKYTPVPNTLVDMHSHGLMSAFFSSTDDRDDHGLGIYVVVGNLDERIPTAMLRVGVYGYFKIVNWEDVFEL